MTLLELSALYEASADALSLRITELRVERQSMDDGETVQFLNRRIAALEPMLRETRETAAVTAHYYDRREREYGRAI